jgi:hypothetical protein
MSIKDSSNFPEIEHLFPKDKTYSSDEIYAIAHGHGYPVEDTPIDNYVTVLEVIACFHHQDEDSVCQETWKESEHETAAEFRTEDGKTYLRVS